MADEPMHLWKVDVTELMFLRPAGDHLDIRWWTPGGGARDVQRH